jgi:hypothetical protein
MAEQKFSKALVDKLEAAISAGAYVETACAIVGISKGLFYRWKTRGAKEGKGPYRDFYLAIERAEAEAEKNAIETIRKAGRRQWTALAWYLERRYPGRWGRKDRLSGMLGGKLEVRIVREDQTGKAEPPPETFVTEPEEDP